jgi:hypothetical protein
VLTAFDPAIAIAHSVVIGLLLLARFIPKR